MARTDRLFRLMHLLRLERPPVTAQSLATALEVTPRTIYRDIGALRAAGAVIDGDAGYGYTLIEDIAMPPQALDRFEAEAVVLGLAALEGFGDPGLSRAARNAGAKIVASLGERRQREVLHAALLTHAYGERPTYQVDIDMLRESCWEERTLAITYRDKAGQRTERRIDPLALAYLERNLAILAWCHLRADFRTFLVASMESAEMTEASFRPRRVPLLRAHLDRLRGGGG